MQLSYCYLFEDLSNAQLSKLITLGKESRIKKGQWIYHENDPADCFYILKDGAVELLTTLDDSFELPITIRRLPGCCFGTAALIPPHKYSLSARGAENSGLLMIKRSDVQKVIQKDHELGQALWSNLAIHFLNRLRESRQELKIHFKNIFRSGHN